MCSLRRMFECGLGDLCFHVFPTPPKFICDSQNDLCWGIRKAENFVKTRWGREEVYSNCFFENINHLVPSYWHIIEWCNSSFLQIIHMSPLFTTLFVWLTLLNDVLSSAEFYSVEWGGMWELHVRLWNEADMAYFRVQFHHFLGQTGENH
jgi:hypothetical protein